MTLSRFGQVPDGDPVLAADLTDGALSARIITWGAALADLRLGARRLVLGLPRLEDYLAHSPHMGAVAGRYAGRIRDGRLLLDGTLVQLTRNAGAHHVHGGARGFGRRNWQVADHGPAHLRLTLTSPDGDEGYPGTLTATVDYALRDGWLWCRATAETTAPTPVNLLFHSYFNLSGGVDIADHLLTIPAAEMVETGPDGLPTGAFVPVAPPFDFRTPRRLDATVAHDVSFRLSDRPAKQPRPAATLQAGGVTLDLWTTEPGLHLYDGHKLALPVPGLDGRRAGPRAGLCLEPTRFSDAPNQPGFPDTILRPGQTYIQQTGLHLRS
jgi:aldose 1-epimerase